MRSWASELRDPRFFVLVGVVFLLHAVHFAGSATSPRAELWLLVGLGWLLAAGTLRRLR